jgi:phosphoenolpyruvate---glycerone phosphotransferase subunit DhaL
MNEIGKNEVARVFKRIRAIMDVHRDELISLDAQIGDGDLGLTMTRAFAAVEDKLSVLNASAADPGKLLALAGMEIGKAAPSTMGTLLAAGFMKGGKAVAGRESLDGQSLAVFLRAFMNAIVELGKAAVGDKTILDVLAPAVEALDKAASGGPLAGMQAALAAARAGLESSKALQARHGRPGIFREKTIGLQDPGATAGVYVIQGFCEAFQAQ